MRRKRKYVKRTSKYEKDAILINSKVISIKQQNEIVGERYKNIFYIESQQFPETGRMCILWGKSSFNVGDEIECKGRINEQGVFLAWTLLILKRAKNECL